MGTVLISRSSRARVDLSAVVVGVVLISLCALSSSCGEPPGRRIVAEPEPEALPLPEGHGPVYEYDPALLSSKEQVALRLEEELRIGGDDADTHALFGGGGSWIRVAVAADGRLFVADPGNGRVQVFGPDGSFVRTIGRTGQGPGEFERPGALAWSDGSLLVVDGISGGAVSLFDPDRHEPYVRSFPRLHRVTSVWPMVGGRFVTMAREPGREAKVVSLLDPGSGERDELVVIPEAPGPGGRNLFRMTIHLFVTAQRAEVATTTHGAFYALGETGYEVARVHPDGQVEWVLRVDWPEQAPRSEDREYLDSLIDELDSRFGVRRPSDWERPETLRAVAAIRADDEGNLYVFPADGYRRDPEYQEIRPRPVHVYSPGGILLQTGTVTMAPVQWQTVQDGKIYGAHLDPETQEWVVTRSRLVMEEPD